MFKESSVIAVAGIRKLIFLFLFLTCGFFGIMFTVIGILKTLGLFGAMAMLTMDGMIPAEDATQNASFHIFITIIVFTLGYLFFYWANIARRILDTPFEKDIKVAAEIVNDIETNTKSNAKSIRDATRSAISDAKNRKNEEP